MINFHSNYNVCQFDNFRMAYSECEYKSLDGAKWTPIKRTFFLFYMNACNAPSIAITLKCSLVFAKYTSFFTPSQHIFVAHFNLVFYRYYKAVFFCRVSARRKNTSLCVGNWYAFTNKRSLIHRVCRVKH